MLRRLLDSPRTYYVLAGLVVVIAVLTQVEVTVPQERPEGTIEDLRELRDRDDLNLVFILIDTLRADHLSSYGFERQTSPVMDYLAETGIRFEKVVSQSSWTKTSMASLWTGTWPRTNGVLRWKHGLPEEAVMPAEILSEAGFFTAGIWRNGWVATNFGFSQGFDIYLRPKPGRNPERFQRNNPSSHPLLGTDEDLTLGAQEFLRAHGHQRFFLYMHYMDIHQYAYDEISSHFGTGYSDAYDNAIHWTDRNVGEIYAGLRDRGLLEKTVLVIASDHGEGFREHGTEGHARTLYREVTHTPWIIALPFRLPEPVVVEPTVANVDIWPTLLDLLGLPPLPGADGKSLVSLIEAAGRGEPQEAPRAAFAQLDRAWGRPGKPEDPLVALTLGDYRLFQPLVPEKASQAELYELAADPWEAENLFEPDDGGVPPEVQAELDAYLAIEAPPWGQQAEDVELDEMELNQLRALGYVIK
ncbi:MAG: sulfatase [Myxococcota bacterium]|nr:sulfatase [Myxococcota bacterium]